MEELHSPEILDREILEDARKKAVKILKNADDNVESQTRKWEKKTQKAIDKIRTAYEQRKTKIEEEILARNPMDKRRARSEIMDFFLRDSMDSFLINLNRDKVLLILERELEKRLEQCWAEILSSGKQEEVQVIFSSMNNEETEIILKKVLENDKINFSKNKVNWVKVENKTSFSSFPAIIINTPSVKITASVEKAATELLKDKRAELISALLGKKALDD